jgi:hypothetical protein
VKRTIIIKDAAPDASASRPHQVGVLRCIVALVCALAADGFQWLVPFLWFLPDAAMVVVLLLTWGWRWEILVAVIPEAIPGLDLFPSWTLFVGYLIARNRKS